LKYRGLWKQLYKDYELNYGNSVIKNWDCYTLHTIPKILFGCYENLKCLCTMWRCHRYCDGKISKDFPMCIKFTENAQTNNHNKYTKIYVKTQEKNHEREREILF